MFRSLIFFVFLVALGQARFYGYPGEKEQLQQQQEQSPPQLNGVLNVEYGNDDSDVLMNDAVVPPNEIAPIDLEYPTRQVAAYAGFHAKEDLEWGRQHLAATTNKKPTFAKGYLAGLAASKDFLYVFHRHNVNWEESSFDILTNAYLKQNEPIGEDTVYALDLVTGEVMFSWGKNSFFMPHGISVDPQGNIWLTDVGLHQAFRYVKNSFIQPDLVLGERFVPGNDESHFCKPTDVAVSSTGLVYISDGYCNSRVVIFSPAGQYLTEIGKNERMSIPHSLTLLEMEDLLCVADRENGRVLCYSAGLETYRPAGQLIFELQPSELHKAYAVAHIGDILLALNGGSEPDVGLSIDLATEQVVDAWVPHNGSFIEAHDITVAPEERSFYVTQLNRGNERSRLIKFNLIETRLIKK